MERLAYNIWFEVPDWRILALAELEYVIVCKAMKSSIYFYQPDDLAQELRWVIWNNLKSYNPTKAALPTWANRVMNNHLINLYNRECNTKKRKDYLCEQFPVKDVESEEEEEEVEKKGVDMFDVQTARPEYFMFNSEIVEII